jgi:hypothetical protein
LICDVVFVGIFAAKVIVIIDYTVCSRLLRF